MLRLFTPASLQSFYTTGVYLGCHAYRSQTSNAAAAANSTATDAPISLQQRMQQALSADIAPATAPKQHAFLERQTASLGSGQGSGPGSRVASEAENVREEDTGFWDLVYILYPDFAEAAGVGALRELVPHWTLLEKTLMVRLLHSHTSYPTHCHRRLLLFQTWYEFSLLLQATSQRSMWIISPFVAL